MSVAKAPVDKVPLTTRFPCALADSNETNDTVAIKAKLIFTFVLILFIGFSCGVINATDLFR